MARARKVEAGTAIEAAMITFWTYGYCDTGTRQIETETGITRFTLQTSYGGKKALFLTALDAYLDLFEASRPLGQGEAPLEELARWFLDRSNSDVMPEVGRLGCFMLNAIMEFSTRDEEVNARAERYFAILRSRFSSALMKAREAGELSDGVDPVEKTEVLLAAILGLNACIRAGGSNEAGQPMAAALAAQIHAWGVNGSKSRSNDPEAISRALFS